VGTVWEVTTCVPGVNVTAAPLLTVTVLENVVPPPIVTVHPDAIESEEPDPTVISPAFCTDRAPPLRYSPGETLPVTTICPFPEKVTCPPAEAIDAPEARVRAPVTDTVEANVAVCPEAASSALETLVSNAFI